MVREAKKGDRVNTLVEIKDRTAPYGVGGSDRKIKTTIAKNTVLTAVTDELGGNIIVQTKDPQDEPIYPSLLDGEWELVQR